MRIPHLTDRVIGAPAQALRTVLRGVGRLLLVADGLRRPDTNGDGDQPESPARGRWRPLDETGNVRLLSPDELAPDELDEAPGPWAVATGDAATGDERPTGDAAATLPVPGYDGLSLASLRARLRGLNVAQVRMLADYERAHAGRTDVLGMFERRIVKLESGS
jgi:hypothetical protein